MRAIVEQRGHVRCGGWAGGVALMTRNVSRLCADTVPIHAHPADPRSPGWMLVPMRLTLVLLLAVAAVLATARDAGAAAWRWPVRGEVITPFAVGGSPFAAGQHRGIDIAARAGEAVRAPCGGPVRFAGRLPGRGRGVTIACGALVATVLELGRVTAAKGDRVPSGAVIGEAAASHVQLGARRDGARHGYVDPLRLLGEDPAAPPPLAGPAPREVERPRARPPLAAPQIRAAPVAAPAGRRVPVVAWIGLVLVGLGVPLGAVVQTATRRRRTGARLPTPSVARSQTR